MKSEIANKVLEIVDDEMLVVSSSCELMWHNRAAEGSLVDERGELCPELEEVVGDHLAEHLGRGGHLEGQPSERRYPLGGRRLRCQPVFRETCPGIIEAGHDTGT